MRSHRERDYSPACSLYLYTPNNPPGTKLQYLNWIPIPRFVTSVPEAMGYVTRSRTRAAGARQDTEGSVVSLVNMGQGGFEFGDQHSAEWVYSIQKTYPFWRRIAEEFNLDLSN
jgi:hypothetical protein